MFSFSMKMQLNFEYQSWGSRFWLHVTSYSNPPNFLNLWSNGLMFFRKPRLIPSTLRNGFNQRCTHTRQSVPGPSLDPKVWFIWLLWAALFCTQRRHNSWSLGALTLFKLDCAMQRHDWPLLLIFQLVHTHFPPVPSVFEHSLTCQSISIYLLCGSTICKALQFGSFCRHDHFW